jgi:lipopolysaccharide/colanic/teichoic acid biosynthesis glycosyltransferase
MMVRLFDTLFALAVLVLTAPLLLATALAIKLSSSGPVLYMANRVGRNEKPFRMYKFRSMHVDSGGSEITATHDNRIFAAGKIIRDLKLDELPQMLNVIKGEMSIVGPRPESPAIVAAHYAPWMHESLKVLPGVTSPGAIFYYTHGDDLLAGDDPEAAYVANLLQPKLAIDIAYSNRASFWSNIFVIFHTVVTIIAKFFGLKVGPLTRDLVASKQLLHRSAASQTPELKSKADAQKQMP